MRLPNGMVCDKPRSHREGCLIKEPTDPTTCVCPFPRTKCPACDNPCRACRYARTPEVTR